MTRRLFATLFISYLAMIFMVAGTWDYEDQQTIDKELLQWASN